MFWASDDKTDRDISTPLEIVDMSNGNLSDVHIYSIFA